MSLQELLDTLEKENRAHLCKQEVEKPFDDWLAGFYSGKVAVIRSIRQALRGPNETS